MHERQPFRDVMGQFASGIVVVTADTEDHGAVGFTCQSFFSLSLEPPMVAFAVSSASQTWERMRSTNRLCINVLAEGQEQLSRGFARSGVNKFEGVNWSSGPSGTPILHGVTAWIEVVRLHEFPGGDHLIVTAAVERQWAHPSRRPLMFFQSRYAGILPHGYQLDGDQSEKSPSERGTH